ncbi:hypothetical protein BDR07DRAFT_1616685 [Suillus spraguei]|nr:hypothetical protein BDR07DRAFT_1616685 [Suillus spraguei]
MFIRLSTPFVMLLSLTALASAGVPLPRSDVDKRDTFVISGTFAKQPDARAEPTRMARSETFEEQPDARGEPIPVARATSK